MYLMLCILDFKTTRNLDAIIMGIWLLSLICDSRVSYVSNSYQIRAHISWWTIRKNASFNLSWDLKQIKINASKCEFSRIVRMLKNSNSRRYLFLNFKKSDIQFCLTYPPTYIRSYPIFPNLPTYPNIGYPLWTAP